MGRTVSKTEISKQRRRKQGGKCGRVVLGKQRVIQICK